MEFTFKEVSQEEFLAKGWGVSVYPAISVYSATSPSTGEEQFYWEDDDTVDQRGPFNTFGEAWEDAGAWLRSEP